MCSPPLDLLKHDTNIAPPPLEFAIGNFMLTLDLNGILVIEFLILEFK